MFNTKQFIKEIQNRPCLWNVTVKEYNCRVVRRNAWLDVAQIMYEDWADFEEKEKILRVRDLQKKWKGLRDYFTRERNKASSVKIVSVTGKKRKTPFLDMLSFLAKKKTTPAPTPQMPQLTETLKDSEESVVVRPTRAKRTFTTQTVTREATERQKDDPDMNFLLSILPDMKSMTPSQNFEFRFEVMTLIRNMKYNRHNMEYYCASGSSSFVHPVPEDKPDIDMDPFSNESVVSSPEDIKVIIQDSD